MAVPELEHEVEATLSKRDALDVLQRQADVLGMIAEGQDLKPTLANIVVALESLIPGARCSILLFNPVTGTLHHGAAPSLPDDYTTAINGMSIGPSAGSCGTAAYLGTAVVAEDIAEDSRWENFRLFALPHSLRSCWSTPIRGRSGITGTFAVYHDSPHQPTARDQLLVDRFTHLASVAIDHARLFGALAQSEEHFRHAFEDNAIGMALVDPDGRLVRVNKALREMTGRPEEDLLATNLNELITLIAATPTLDTILRELIGGARDRVQVAATTLTAKGHELRLVVDFAVIKDADGQPLVLGVNLLDVTHRRAVDAERRARREADVARRVAESASRNKSEFVAAMSHDIRTPLQSIAGFTEMLRTMDLSAERRQTALEHIDRATRHITALVNDVLDIARIEAGSLPIRIADVPIDPLIEDVVEIDGPLAESRQVSVQWTPAAVSLRADEHRLRQVLLNLVTNAITYNKPDGTVTIDVHPEGNDVVIRITNTGAGIPQDRLDRLFVPFDRLGAEETGEPGVGLGLTLSLGLTEAMGGTLTVSSEPGVGTTVQVSLPKSAS